MGGYPSEHVIRFVARNYYNRDRKNIRILDFGCGQGAHTWYLAKEGFDTYAFDGSPSATERAQNLIKEMGLSVNFLIGNGGDKLYPENTFDAIIDNACVCTNNMDDIKKMYDNIYGYLKIGGRMLSSCFGEETYGYQTGREIEKNTFADIKEGCLTGRGRIHIFTMESLEKTLKEFGFMNIRCDYCKYLDKGSLVHLLICQAEK